MKSLFNASFGSTTEEIVFQMQAELNSLLAQLVRHTQLTYNVHDAGCGCQTTTTLTVITKLESSVTNSSLQIRYKLA